MHGNSFGISMPTKASISEDATGSLGTQRTARQRFYGTHAGISENGKGV